MDQEYDGVQIIEEDEIDIEIEDTTQETQILYTKPFDALCPFEVSLTSYSMQPWTNRNVDLSQWFNYGFNPSTWSKYCMEQLQYLKKNE
jgi:hypothetical protein